MFPFPLIPPVIFLPTDIANLVAWYRADLGVTKSSDLVSQWDDQSGNSRNVTEATNKPLWVDSLVNGYPAIRFDGTNDKLQEAGGTVSQPIHFFMVANQVSWSINDSFFAGTGGSSTSLIQNATTPKIRLTQGTSADELSGMTLGTFFLVHGIANGASTALSLNDGSSVGGTISSGGFVTGLGLGSEGGGQFSNVEIAEFMYYSAAITGANLIRIKNYLNNRYSLW